MNSTLSDGRSRPSDIIDRCIPVIVRDAYLERLVANPARVWSDEAQVWPECLVPRSMGPDRTNDLKIHFATFFLRPLNLFLEHPLSLLD
jgi:hypothetical protein